MIGRIRDRRMFERLGSCGRSVRRGPLTVRYVPLAADERGPLVAFAIGRRFGPAVARNRARRRLRAAFRQAAGRAPQTTPYALLVQARPVVLDRPFTALVEDAAQILNAVSASADRR